ncbi:unnamed protein product, partial [Strongylus vulgaris]
MSMPFRAVLLISCAGAALAQFYTLGGYACSQPILYIQCGCPSFCGSYGGGGGYGGGFPDYNTWSRQHPHKKRRRHHKKKKFRFETAEEPDSSELSPPPSKPEDKPDKPKGSKHSWEDEDDWEKKFVNPKSKSSAPKGSEELPDITSEEISSAKSRLKSKSDDKENQQSSALSPAVNTHPRGGAVGEAGDVGGPVSTN